MVHSILSSLLLIVYDVLQGMRGQDIMQMLENHERLECPEKCPESVYEVMLRCWSWR